MHEGRPYALRKNRKILFRETNKFRFNLNAKILNLRKNKEKLFNVYVDLRSNGI